jgi:hypothetical protein
MNNKVFYVFENKIYFVVNGESGTCSMHEIRNGYKIVAGNPKG